MTIAMVFTVVNTWAARVDEARAHDAARSFLENRAAGGSLRAVITPGGGDVQLVITEMSNVVNGQAVFYVYNSASNFVVIAGDSRVPEVIAYGDTPLDVNDIPCGLQFLLDLYKEEIDYLFSHSGDVVMLNSQRLAESASIAPLLTTLWSQHEPYNRFCPEDGGEKTLTGCACTSLSMVFHYWKYSAIGAPLAGYTTNSQGIVVDELAPTTFDWDNMLDDYNGSYTDEQGDAVALLMRYVGQAERMDYGVRGSGAYNSDIVNATVKFGYDQGVKLKDKFEYTDSQWRAAILKELQAGRPVVYVGYDKNGAGGHAFNVDGYDASNGLYHINFGWGGNGNAYCALNDFTGGSYTFSSRQGMIVGIQPPDIPQPVIEVSPSSLSFSATVGQSVEQSFTVRGIDLNEDLTVALDDPESVFTVSKSVITASQAASTATVTVTYQPAAGGQNQATVTVSGGGAQPCSVALIGNAEAPGEPAIDVDCMSLDFGEGYNGYRKRLSFTLTGENLTGDITLALTGDDSIHFELATQHITPGQAAQGAVVSVSFFPYREGLLRTKLTISSPDVDDIIIPVSGFGIKTGAYIVPSEDSIAMEAIVGRPVTMLLGVKKTDFDGWIAMPAVGETGAAVIPGGLSLLSVSASIEGDDCFTAEAIDHQSLSSTTDSITFKVTYNPLAAGNHSARLVLETTSLKHRAHPVTVELTGVAIIRQALQGDVNGDGSVTVTDLAMLVNAVVNDTTEGIVVDNADIDGDGLLTIGDIALLIDLLLLGS